MNHTDTNISDFAKEFFFEDIRAFYDHEVKEIMERLIGDPQFMKMVNYLWPTMTFEEVQQKASRVERNIDFQLEFMYDAIRTIVKSSSTGLTSSGFEQLEKGKPYLFIANHRDILLDAALLQVLLVEHGLQTSEITFGSNLKEKGFITDFGRLNRMFTVFREGTSKELYEISRKLSAYIRHTIVDKQVSVWIAQRNGRTKDGNDVTQSGLLKMLNLSGKKSFSENFLQLNVVPVTVSYEYEPCDFLKTQELYLSNLHTKYTKAQGEDIESIVTGIKQFKGRIHVAIGTPVREKDFQHLNVIENDNDRITALCSLIDKRVYHDYKLNPVNYIACDLLRQTDAFEDFYKAEEKDNFITYMDEQLSLIKGERNALEAIFLSLYAQPVINKLGISE